MSESSPAGDEIEILRDEIAHGRFRAVLFDFDGTLSLIRRGWPEVMIPMMVDILAETPQAESRDQLAGHVEEFVMRLNGRQTIYQMMQLADEVRQRGGQPADPLDYKRQYHDLLWKKVDRRIADVQSGDRTADEMTVPGSHALLTALEQRGLDLYLASGTDLVYVENEVEVLGLAPYFGKHVYGALDEYRNFSKRMIIEQIIETAGVPGDQLLGFGDGFVEIEEIRRAGGVAVGVASEEQSRQGINHWKRERLVRAGADMIIGDYRRLDQLLDSLGLAAAQ